MLKCIRSAAIVPLVAVIAACSTGESATSGSNTLSAPSSTMAEPVSEDAVLKKDSLAALQTLYAKEPKAKEIGAKSKAILIFPNIVKAAFLAGIQGGDGVLIENGKVTGV